jgi:predicted transcriptional regulator of viral defense system
LLSGSDGLKELSLYQIKDMALDSGRSVFSVQQLSNLIGKPKAVCTVYSSRLVKKGLAVRLVKGKISFEKDDFVIASQLIEPSYISLNSALLFHGIIKQMQKNIECVTTKNSLKFRKLGIVYHKIPFSFLFGFKKHLKGKSYVMVAEPEKAVLDALYLNVFSEKDLEEISDKISFEKLKVFLKKFKGKGRKKLERMILHD